MSSSSYCKLSDYGWYAFCCCCCCHMQKFVFRCNFHCAFQKKFLFFSIHFHNYLISFPGGKPQFNTSKKHVCPMSFPFPFIPLNILSIVGWGIADASTCCSFTIQCSCAEISWTLQRIIGWGLMMTVGIVAWIWWIVIEWRHIWIIDTCGWRDARTWRNTLHRIQNFLGLLVTRVHVIVIGIH